MADGISNYFAGKILDWLEGSAFPSAPTNVYVALFDGDPSDTGVEITTSVRAAGRLAVGFVDHSTVTRRIINAALINFGASANSVSIGGFALFDAASSGNMLAHKELTTPVSVSSGSTVTYAAGAISFDI